MNKQKHHWHSLLFMLLGLLLAAPGTFAQTLKPAGDQPKWVNELPQPPRLNFMDFNGNGNPVQRFIMREGPGHDFGLYDTDGNPIGPVPAWAYEFVANGNNPNLGAAATYLGPTIEAYRDRRIKIRWENNLPGNHLLAVDNSLHMPHLGALNNIPSVTHLHGGHTESASDGLPEAWYTAGLAQTGPYFVKDVYTYDNDQEAATLWYHDHTLGLTRLNVYAGLAGFYLLRDDNEMELINYDDGEQPVLPSGSYEREIVIQDRQFASNGHLYMPADGGSEGDCYGPDDIPVLDEFPLAEEPQPSPPTSIVAEFFGQYITVNGKAWPYMDVEPRKYRLRLLNGSDSRVYMLSLRKALQPDGKGNVHPSMDNPQDNMLDILQIGTDNGLREDPLKLQSILLAPGERMDVIVDFSGVVNGDSYILTNVGPDEPFKGGESNPRRPQQLKADYEV